MAYVYQAALYCDDCGELIRDELEHQGKAPADPDDEHSYDSDDYPKGPYPDGGGESDGVWHCDAHEDCENAIELPSGRKIGAWLENPLTPDGVAWLCEVLRTGRGDLGVHALWREWYADELADCDLDDDDDDDDQPGMHRFRWGKS